jgi:phosphoserine phosphatase
VIFLLIAFDLEGTLLNAELFPEIGRALYKADALDIITAQGMNGELGFEESLSRRFVLVKGLSIERIRDVCNQLPTVKGARETVEALRELGCVPAIISGGFEMLANRVAGELGIEIVCANRFGVERGYVKAVRKPIVTPRLKADLFINIALQLGFDPRRCVAVGDGANDIPMMEVAGLSIAFNGKRCVKEIADVVVDGDDLREIVEHVSRFRGFLKNIERT